MLNSQFSIVQRLPDFYSWQDGAIGILVEPWHQLARIDTNKLVGLKLLGDRSERVEDVMRYLSQQLTAIYVDNAVVELDSEFCLFVNYYDQSATFCCLRNLGLAIAEPFMAAPDLCC